MDPNGGRDSRYNLNYSMSMMGDQPEIYGNPNVSLARPGSGLSQVMSRGGGLMPTNNSQCGGLSRGIKRTNSDCFDDRSGGGLGGGGGGGGGGGAQSQYDCSINDVTEDSYTQLQPKKSPPSNGKKTKGRVKIKMEYIDNKLRRYTTFSKRKTGIMKKAYELSTLTGTQVMLLVASETGHVYTFATRKLQPMITSEAGKALIQTCLNSPDPPSGASDQRMSATGFEETELSYNIGDEDSKDDRSPMSSDFDEDDSGPDSPSISQLHQQQHQPGNSQQPTNNISVDNDNSINSSLNLTTTAKQQQVGAEPVAVSMVTQPLSVSSLALHQQQQQQLQQKLLQQQEHRQSTATLTPITTTTSGGGSIALAGNGQAATSKVEFNPMNSILYPASALANLPQDVLVSLVQSGQLQIHTDQDGAHQYITIPLSMMPGGGSKATTTATTTTTQQSKTTSQATTAAAAAASSATSATNGNNKSATSKNEMNIKTEIID